MSTNDIRDTNFSPAPEEAAPGKPLSPAAQRALEEAAERRRGSTPARRILAARKEHNGRGGLEPVR